MEPIAFFGLIVGLLGAAASALGNSNLFLTNKQADNSIQRAAKEDKSRSSERHQGALDAKERWKDNLNLIGAGATVFGAGWALVWYCIENWPLF